MNYYFDPIMNHYADFEGKATRRQYGMFILINFIITALIAWVSYLVFEIQWPSYIYSLVLFLPLLSNAVRRLHDMGMSGWWVIGMFIPLVNVVLFLMLLFKDSAAPAAAPDTTSQSIS